MGRQGRHRGPASAVSALDGWIDVCRTGTWRDASNRDVVVDEPMLDGLVEAYAVQDPAPVVVGHPAQDAPAYGWVEALRRSGDRLQARLRDLAPAFRSAVESNAYPGRSVAIATGKLRHLGFLGGRAPAVPGLAPSQFASPPETVIEFAVDGDEGLWQIRAGWMAMARVARAWRERLIADVGVEAADRVIPGYEVESISHAAEAVREMETGGLASPERNHAPEDPPMSGANPNTPPDEAALAARAAALDAREAVLAASEAASAAAAVLRDADEALQAHVAAGRVLPAERASLAALIASLPGDETTISFAASEGAGEVQEKPRAVLERFLGALPKRVEYAEVAGGPLPAAAAGSGDEDGAGIAAEARALMSEAAGRGETLTAIQAVDQVRAKRGLPTGGAA